MLSVVLAEQEIDPRRAAIEWVSSAEAARFAEVVSAFTETIRSLGPNPTKQNRNANLRDQIPEVREQRSQVGAVPGG